MAHLALLFLLLTTIFSWLQHAQELIKEIAVLELEVVYLEQYLLSLYRKKFDQQISSLPTVEERSNWTAVMPKENFGEVGGYDAISEKEDRVIHSSPLMLPRNSSANPPEWIDLRGSQKLLDSSIHRSHSSLSQNSAYLTRTPPKAVDSYHSLPLSMLEVTSHESIGATLERSLAFFLVLVLIVFLYAVVNIVGFNESGAT